MHLVNFGDVAGRESRSGDELPHGLGQVEAERRARADGDAHEDAEEAELVQVRLRGQRRVQDQAVPARQGRRRSKRGTIN